MKAEQGDEPTGFQEEKTYYYTKDILGSPVVITDEDIDVVRTYKYDVYGNEQLGVRLRDKKYYLTWTESYGKMKT